MFIWKYLIWAFFENAHGNVSIKEIGHIWLPPGGFYNIDCIHTIIGLAFQIVYLVLWKKIVAQTILKIFIIAASFRVSLFIDLGFP